MNRGLGEEWMVAEERWGVYGRAGRSRSGWRRGVGGCQREGGVLKGGSEGAVSGVCG